MTRDEIIALIRDRLAFNESLNEAIILRHLDVAQARYEQNAGRTPRPWFTLDTTNTVATVADTRTIALPSDFIEFDEEWPLTILDSGGVTYPLERKSFDVLVADTDLATAMPTHYAVGDSQLWLYPKPDAVYTINLPYYKRLPQLSTTTTSDWFVEFPMLLVEEAVLSIARSTRDEMAIKLSEVKLFRDDYLVRVEERKQSLRELGFLNEVT